MTSEVEAAARAVGLVRLVATGEGDAGRYLLGHLTAAERLAVASVLERLAAAIAAGVVRLTLEAELLPLATAVVDLLALSARLDGLDADQLERDVLSRLDGAIWHTASAEA